MTYGYYVYVWPNGFWCLDDQLDECLFHSSDDYEVVLVPFEIDIDEVENYIFP